MIIGLNKIIVNGFIRLRWNKFPTPNQLPDYYICIIILQMRVIFPVACCEKDDIMRGRVNTSTSHNVTVLLYHLVCPAQYRRVVFDDKVKSINFLCSSIIFIKSAFAG